jgi:hypothetical protein
VDAAEGARRGPYEAVRMRRPSPIWREEKTRKFFGGRKNADSLLSLLSFLSFPSFLYFLTE